MTRRVVGAAALSLMLAASMGWAQEPPVRVRGVIEKVDGSVLTVKARDSSTLTVRLADKVRVAAIVKSSLDEIKKGSFIGVTALPQADGNLRAIAIHIFLDAQRGVVPERHGPWDLQPGSTMTNAIVEATVAGVNGPVLTVKYKDGEKKVIVPPNTPIVKYAPGNKDELKPGAQIIIIAAKKLPDGTLETASINVGRGVTPPM
jgi:hypothetical protein